MSEGIIAIRQLQGLLGRADRGQLTALVRNAHRFALSYRWIVEQAPLQAYTSALVFAPTSSLVKKIFKAEESNLVSTKPVVEAEWNACLQTLEGHDESVLSVAFSLDDPGRHGYGLGQDQTWIICNGRRVLWLPPEYRPSCSAVQGRMISIGCKSGRVFTIGFSRDV
ncbi:hypothetical protein F5883DRAFT_227674 [Diaporthe sp. PMI_573]|nr:hypothetical protein F5883DRAFT_227674 [Diaporthaceae sp. PMI_573]